MMRFLPSFLSLVLLLWGHQCSATLLDNTTTCSSDDGCLDSAAKNDETDGGTHKQHDDAPSTCSLYVAPSTIPNAGLGVFTSVPLVKGTAIHDGDVILPLVDLDYYQEYDDTFNPFLNYLWNAQCFGMHYQAQSPHSTTTFAPGMTSLMNTSPSNSNVKRGDDFMYDSYIGGHRGASPMSGSMTPFSHSPTIASTDIAAGSELFINYGSDWIESREESDYDTILEAADTTTKSLQQLQDTGRCMDTIRSGESTLDFAGRGAFVTRDVSKDSIITGSPLIHVPYESLLYLYDFIFDQASQQDLPDFDEHNGYQLLMNYCYSHPQTFMMLCPYGSGVNFINHDQQRANVKMQWTPHGVLNMNDEWLSMSPHGMEYEYKPQLSMDYVALRDLKEGEELFLDYGDEWQEAWEEYLEGWEPVQHGGMSAQHWNYENRDKILYDMKEQDWKIYPNNLEMHCHPSVFFGEYEQLQQRGVTLEQLWPNDEKGYVCDVHSRQVHATSGSITYTVNVFHPEYEIAVTRRGVTREFVTMIDRPYTLDWHRRDAFRHSIGIPDEVFPTAWKFNATDFESEDDEEDEEYDRDADEEV